MALGLDLFRRAPLVKDGLPLPSLGPLLRVAGVVRVHSCVLVGGTRSFARCAAALPFPAARRALRGVSAQLLDVDCGEPPFPRCQARATRPSHGVMGRGAASHPPRGPSGFRGDTAATGRPPETM